MTEQRRRGRLWGRVQGVGMRPFVAELARSLELRGWVRNEGGEVVLEAQGARAQLDRLSSRLVEQAPAAARVEGASWSARPVEPCSGFEIVASQAEGRARVGVAPDRRVCEACLAEVRDPEDRRSAHPFTTCLDCGPRFSVTQALPYDRSRTSMAELSMCERCQAEHDRPGRRHHAQALACPRCGPRLRLRGADGANLAAEDEALRGAIEALRRGGIVALQGVGGFQLVVDATDEAAVDRLRRRKERPAKPLAVMVASVPHARTLAVVGELEAEVLASPEGPIVLVDRRGGGLAPSVAPGQPRLGLMLPTTPLHALLLDGLGQPLVATSGNRHDEPIAVDEDEALTRLAGVADAFLVHDRAIVRRADDSVVQVVAGRPRLLRLGRGHAPLRVSLPGVGAPRLALGAHLKHAPALASEGEVMLWPHVGDLDSPLARIAMGRSLEDLERMAGTRAHELVVDAHPDYATMTWAEADGRPIQRVWHHHAHVAAVLAEHGDEAALGFAWDGTGLGPDGTAWGGEALEVSGAELRRVAHLRAFPLPGGDAAARDGRRALAGLLAAAGRPAPAELAELEPLMAVARSPRLSPVTSSMGRMFDAVAALTGVRSRSRYEGEAAMCLEALAEPGAEPYPLRHHGPELDWRPMLDAMLDERSDAVRVASRFHATLCAMVVDVVARRRASVVALAGGCFVNRRLTESIDAALRERGVTVRLSEAVPPSDGGLALGQAWVAARRSPCA